MLEDKQKSLTLFHLFSHIVWVNGQAVCSLLIQCSPPCKGKDCGSQMVSFRRALSSWDLPNSSTRIAGCVCLCSGYHESNSPTHQTSADSGLHAEMWKNSSKNKTIYILGLQADSKITGMLTSKNISMVTIFKKTFQ